VDAEEGDDSESHDALDAAFAGVSGKPRKKELKKVAKKAAVPKAKKKVKMLSAHMFASPATAPKAPKAEDDGNEHTQEFLASVGLAKAPKVKHAKKVKEVPLENEDFVLKTMSSMGAMSLMEDPVTSSLQTSQDIRLTSSLQTSQEEAPKPSALAMATPKKQADRMHMKRKTAGTRHHSAADDAVKRALEKAQRKRVTEEAAEKALESVKKEKSKQRVVVASKDEDEEQGNEEQGDEEQEDEEPAQHTSKEEEDKQNDAKEKALRAIENMDLSTVNRAYNVDAEEGDDSESHDALDAAFAGLSGKPRKKEVKKVAKKAAVPKAKKVTMLSERYMFSQSEDAPSEPRPELVLANVQTSPQHFKPDPSVPSDDAHQLLASLRSAGMSDEADRLEAQMHKTRS